MQESAKHTPLKFHNSDQAIVEEIYAHLNQASEAYKTAKKFFGTKYEHEITTYTLTQTDCDRIRVEFPNFDPLQPDSFTAQNYPGSLQSTFAETCCGHS